MVDKNWKKKNYNLNIRVSEQSIKKLRAGGSFSANIAAAKKQGAGLSAMDREALNRFYGKARVSSALGTTSGKKANNAMTGSKATSVAPAHNATTYVPKGPTGYRPSATNMPTTVAAKPSPSAMSKAASGTGNFIKNELLGVDDFSKLRGEMKAHHWKDMAKSFGEGVFELGTTIGAVAAAVPTGGASLAADAARIAAKQAGKQAVKAVSKQAIKQSAKESAKTVVTKAGAAYAKGPVRGVALGAVKGTGKVALGAAKAPVRGYKAAQGAYRGAKATAEAERYAKGPVGLGEARAKAAAEAAKKVTAKADAAAADAKAKKAALDALHAAAKGRRPAKGTAAATRAHKASVAARDAANAAARKANKSAGNVSKAAAARKAKATAAAAAKAKRKAALRGATKTNLKIRGTGAAVNYYNGK